MNKDHSWKRTEEVEADLPDLMCRLCLHWKQALLCIIIPALLMGGYGWLKNRNETAAQENTKIAKVDILEEDEQAVADAVRLKEETEELEEYVENSIWMQVEPYRKPRIYLLYSIHAQTQQTLLEAAESYVSFILNGGAAEAIRKADPKMRKTESKYLTELLSAGRKANQDVQLVFNKDEEDKVLGMVLYAEVTGKDGDMAQQIADNLQHVLQEHVSDVKKVCGPHSLTLLSAEKNVKADWEMRSQQRSVQDLLSSGRTNLKTLTDAFNQEQKIVYESRIGILNQNKESKGETNVQSKGSGIRVKYILAGGLFGLFAFCGVYACWYLLSDVIKSAQDFKLYYTLPFFGNIDVKKRGLEPQDKDAEGEYALLLKRIRLACSKQGVARLCLAADFPLCGAEKECMEQIAGQLQKWDIETAVFDKVTQDAAAWDQLMEIGSSLLICRIGSTTRRMIDEEMEFYKENSIAVIGAATLEVR